MTEPLSGTAPAYTGAAPDLDKPFPTASSLPVFYQRPAYEGTASELAKSVRSGLGLTVIIGEPGTGKTSFVANAIGHLGSQLRPVFLWYPHLSVEVMLSYACEQLGLVGEQLPASSEQKPGNDALRHHLFTLLQDGPSVILVIDDAHAAQDDVLTEALWLTRTRSAQHHIATILVGLPQLEERLCSPPLAELIGELPPPIRIKPFWPYEVREFIRLQLRARGGGREDRFGAEAIARITSYSRGIPRLVKTLFDATLITADLDALETITEDTVEDAVRLFSPPWAKEAMQLPDDAEADSNVAPARVVDDTAATPVPLSAIDITGKRNSVEELFSKLWSRGTTQPVQGRHDTRHIYDDEYGHGRGSTGDANPLTPRPDTLDPDTLEEKTIVNIARESEKPMSRTEDLNKVLKRLQAGSPDVEAAALISEDGLMIAGALPQDLEETRVAGMSATLLSLGTRAATELRRGDIEEVIVRGEHGYAVMLNAGRGVLLLVVANENAMLGLIFFDMREAIGAIKRIL